MIFLRPYYNESAFKLCRINLMFCQSILNKIGYGFLNGKEAGHVFTLQLRVIFFFQSLKILKVTFQKSISTFRSCRFLSMFAFIFLISFLTSPRQTDKSVINRPQLTSA